jgi:hypothetical protein
LHALYHLIIRTITDDKLPIKVERHLRHPGAMSTSMQRQLVVERHIESRGISDPRVLAAMSSVPREEFLPPDLGQDAAQRSLLEGRDQMIDETVSRALENWGAI